MLEQDRNKTIKRYIQEISPMGGKCCKIWGRAVFKKGSKWKKEKNLFHSFIHTLGNRHELWCFCIEV